MRVMLRVMKTYINIYKSRLSKPKGLFIKSNLTLQFSFIKFSVTNKKINKYNFTK